MNRQLEENRNSVIMMEKSESKPIDRKDEKNSSPLPVVSMDIDKKHLKRIMGKFII